MMRLHLKKISDLAAKRRRALFESLESRLLLDVGRGISEAEFETIKTEYPGFDYAEIAPEKVWTLDGADGIDVDSLRQAITAAQKNDGADLIVVKINNKNDASVVFSRSSDSLVVDDPSPLTIVALGTEKLTLDGASKARLLTITSRSNVGIGGVIFTGGVSSAGGAIYNSGNLTLDRVWVAGNASTGVGGGVYNESTLTVVNSIISGNRATKHGGGVYSTGSYSNDGDDKILTFANDTITGNVAGYESDLGLGGGIYFQGVDSDYNIFANARLYNSIVVQNRSSATQGDVNIYNSLFYNEIEIGNERWTFEEPVPGLIDGDYNLTSFVYWESYYDVEDEQEVGTNQIYNASIPLFIADYDFEAELEGNYALCEIEASQAIDRGGRSVATYPNGRAITRDFNGNLRVCNLAPDVGAYETLDLDVDLTISGAKPSISAAPIGTSFRLDGVVVTNVGAVSSATSTVVFYASTDAAFDESDVALGEKTLGALAPQESRVFSSGELSTAFLESGKSYYVFCRIVAKSDVDESNNICRSLDSVYFFDEQPSDLEDWNFGRESYEVSQGCAFFADVVAAPEVQTRENLSIWFDYGDGVFRQGARSGWISPSQYEGTSGTYSLVAKVVDDDLRKVVGVARAELTVKKTSPTISVDARRVGDGSVLALNLNVFSPIGLPVKKWEIDWGDGSMSTFNSLGFSLTAGRRYASNLTDVSYSVTLKLYDSETEEGIACSIGSFFVPGVSESDVDASIDATSDVFGPALCQAKFFSPKNASVSDASFSVQKKKNVFEELCETNWLDE